MANPYCNPTQFALYLDARVGGQLSRDDGNRLANAATQQELLDAAAGELESYLTGRYALPLATIPPVLRRWVAALAIRMLYGRRSNLPGGVKSDVDQFDRWATMLIEGKVGLPGIDPQYQPALDSSDATDGRSRFDWVFGFGPSKTGPSRGE
jgi:phage gp36-like protein